MSTMNFTFSFSDGFDNFKNVKAFTLLRDHVLPVLEERRADLESMYSPVMGRPEVDPVLLTAVTILQMMEKRPDRAAVEACCYDVRWRVALGLPADWKPFHPTSLVYFRKRMIEHDSAGLVMDAGLEAMRRDGYFGRTGSIRIDSTHILGAVSKMSRLACVRETFRSALRFLAQFTSSDDWEPWYSIYEERNPDELRGASKEVLKRVMTQAGCDVNEVLNKINHSFKEAAGAEPVALLRRVFNEQYTVSEDGEVVENRATCSGAVKNPNDPEAGWSTKDSIETDGWIGYKLQVCETVPEQICDKGEPTSSVITAVVTQPATTSDHGSLDPVLQTHKENGQGTPEEIYVDAGYVSAGDIKHAEERGYELNGPVAGPPSRNKCFKSDAFQVDIPLRKAVCPAGEISSSCVRIHDHGKIKVVFRFEWPRAVCAACTLKDKCISPSKKIVRRRLEVGENHMYIQQRRKDCATPEYKELMKRRNAVEGTHSELARGYGVRRCRYKGLAKTKFQHLFTGAACNLRRWAARLCWQQRCHA
jgi:hypothetical protein